MLALTLALPVPSPNPNHTGEQLQACLTRKKGAVAGWGERHTTDGHFRQEQTDFCGGLGAALGGYQVVQQLEHSTSRERVVDYVENKRSRQCPELCGSGFCFPHLKLRAASKASRLGLEGERQKVTVCSPHIGGRDARAQQHHQGPPRRASTALPAHRCEWRAQQARR